MPDPYVSTKNLFFLVITEFGYYWWQIHGILNAVSWGVLFPVGIIIARYLRTFESADPLWFNLHVGCQLSAYAIGVAGWATGLQLGSKSKGIQHTSHRNLGIALFSLATLQVLSFPTPFWIFSKDSSMKICKNFQHISLEVLLQRTLPRF